MPWPDNTELPKSIRDNLPEKAQTIWRKTANSALKQYGDSNKAYATAWASVRRSGYDKKDGKWIEVEKDSPTSSQVHVNVPLGEEKETEKSFEGGDSGSSNEKIHWQKTASFEIKKTNNEQQIAFGWAVWSQDRHGNPVKDYQDDMIDPEELEKLAYKFVEFYRDGGEMHIKSGVAQLIESIVFTTEKQQLIGIPHGCVPVGWWVGFHITDKDVWNKIKSGLYNSFSIEGTAQREKMI